MAKLPPKGEIQKDFNAKKDDRPTVLYHAIPRAPEGDEIRASTRYGMDIRPEILEQLGVKDTDHPPLVFASAHMTKALAFALDGALGEKSLNMGIEGTNDELVVVTDREKTMSRPRDARLYAFSSEGFVDLPYANRQMFSTSPVKFSEAQTVLEVKSADDLMRAGLQILSFREGLQEIWRDETLIPVLEGKEDFHKGMSRLIAEGRVVWENHARGINPNPVLAERLGVTLTAPQKKPVPGHAP